MTDATTISAVPNIDMGALLGTPESNPEPKTPLEHALANVTPEDAAAGIENKDAAQFSFRSLLNEKQREDLKKNAPAVAEKMVGDYNAIIQFGAPVLTKLNNASIELLNEQRNIRVPEADRIVNDLLRNIDGYSNKYHNQQVENAVEKLVSFFKGAGYSLKTMVRESKPIVEKIDMAEVQLKQMELELADNVSAGQKLHKTSNEVLNGVVGVLAALEEIIEVAKADFTEVDKLLTDAEKQSNGKQDGLVTVEYKGKTISLNDLRDRHTMLANGISEMEKSWFDWRQQFFLGYATAPTILNIILISATMQRRCQVFRTMGLPSARRSLALWQQAVLAKEGAEMGTVVAQGTNKLIQGSFQAAGDAVGQVAMAAQTPIISEETVFEVINSVKKQAQDLVAADKWGRDQRAKNVRILEAGEAGINQTFTESRRQLVANAVTATQTPQELAPQPDEDILASIGATREI